jgi:hypothetical protein
MSELLLRLIAVELRYERTASRRWRSVRKSRWLADKGWIRFSLAGIVGLLQRLWRLTLDSAEMQPMTVARLVVFARLPWYD